MKPEDRRDDIVEMLMEQGSATLEELAGRFSVSRMTIHRDLDDLEAEGLLRKVRGGATIESSGQFESDFRYRTRLAAEEKSRITRRAADFITPGTSIMIDDGSTSRTIVPYLLDKRPLTVITNNLSIIEELSEQNGINLIALGGSYTRKFNGFFGVLTHNALGALRADLALVSTSAIQHSTAFHQDQEVLAIKRQMVQASAASYLMVDHQKFGKTALHLFSELNEFDGVITSSDIDPEVADTLRREGIPLYLSEETNNE